MYILFYLITSKGKGFCKTVLDIKYVLFFSTDLFLSYHMWSHMDGQNIFNRRSAGKHMPKYGSC